MKFTNSSFNRDNLSYCPNITPFNPSNDTKRFSEEPKHRMSPKRKPLNSHSKKSRLTIQHNPFERASSFLNRNCESIWDEDVNPNMLLSKNYSNIQKQKKISKSNTLQQFKLTLNQLRDRISENQYQVDEDTSSLQKQYLHQIKIAQSQFQEVFELLNVRFGKCLERIKQKYESAKRSIITYSIAVEETLQSLDRFQSDVDKNYSSIVNDLDMQSFYGIMAQYRVKLNKASVKIQNLPDLNLEISDEKQSIHGMMNMLTTSNLVKGYKPPYPDENRENDINFSNVIISPTKTTKNTNK